MRHLLTVVLLITSGVASGALAQDPLAYIEARKQIMKFVGGEMRRLAPMAQGQVDFNADIVQLSGHSLAVMATSFPLLFPPGTESGGRTQAAQRIFDDPKGFAEKATEWKMSGELIQQAQSVAQFQLAFASLAATCKACHSQYRN